MKFFAQLAVALVLVLVPGSIAVETGDELFAEVEGGLFYVFCNVREIASAPHP